MIGYPQARKGCPTGNRRRIDGFMPMEEARQARGTQARDVDLRLNQERATPELARRAEARRSWPEPHRALLGGNGGSPPSPERRPPPVLNFRTGPSSRVLRGFLY